MQNDKLSWKEVKNIFKNKYKELPLKDSKISNYISHFTVSIWISSLALLCALIASVIIKKQELITNYGIFFGIVFIFTIIISFTLTRKNLYSIVLYIWKHEFDFVLPSVPLLLKLESYIFLLTFKRYWFTWIVVSLIWIIIFICTFLL